MINTTHYMMLSAALFTLLQRNGIPTHFVEVGVDRIVTSTSAYAHVIQHLLHCLGTK